MELGARLKHLLVWGSRLHRCRGFGVQSPTDYAFIRYVINEHWPYYEYECLAQRGDDWLTGKLGRLYFRVANWRQPMRILSYDGGMAYYGDYLHSGCKKAMIVPLDTHTDAKTLKEYLPLEMLVVTPTEGYEHLLQRVLDVADERTVCVIEAIHRDDATLSVWKKLIADQRTGITFDLYYCGIVMFDTKRYKRNYIVNF